MTIQERYEGIQNVLYKCGAEGCLFLCLCSIAEEVTGKPVDLVGAIRTCQKNWSLAADFNCNDSIRILSTLTGREWKRFEVTDPQFIAADNQYTVAKYVNGKKQHFRRRSWDVYDNSIAVREGKFVGLYVYEVI